MMEMQIRNIIMGGGYRTGRQEMRLLRVFCEKAVQEIAPRPLL